MDRIVIKDLKIYGYHGVLDEEKKNGQEFVITAFLGVNLREAGMKDKLSETVNYASVCQDIRKVVTENRFDLIEALGENVADTILLGYDMVKEARIVISKPQAPIDMDFDTVCVDITRKKHTAYLGIGSNLGDREAYLDYAVDQLNKDEYIKVTKISSYIETEPYGNVEQDDFLNGCLEIETMYTPGELFQVVNDIEEGAGRKRLIHWGPRTLDIDILLYDRELIMDDRLTIPHIEMGKRYFVLKPLYEIAPYAYHPGYNKTVMELYEAL